MCIVKYTFLHLRTLSRELKIQRFEHFKDISHLPVLVTIILQKKIIILKVLKFFFRSLYKNPVEYFSSSTLGQISYCSDVCFVYVKISLDSCMSVRNLRRLFSDCENVSLVSAREPLTRNGWNFFFSNYTIVEKEKERRTHFERMMCR